MKQSPNFEKCTFPTLKDGRFDLTLLQMDSIKSEGSAFHEIMKIFKTPRDMHSVCLLGASGCGKTSTIFQVGMERWIIYVEAAIDKPHYQKILPFPQDVSSFFETDFAI